MNYYRQECERLYTELTNSSQPNPTLLTHLTQKNNAMAYFRLGLTNELSLFIDDERFPTEWGTTIILRSMNDWLTFSNRFGRKYPIVSISFDHDLGNHQPSGLAILRSMIDQNRLDHSVDFFVHSQNPIGAKQISDYFQSFKRQCR